MKSIIHEYNTFTVKHELYKQKIPCFLKSITYISPVLNTRKIVQYPGTGISFILKM